LNLRKSFCVRRTMTATNGARPTWQTIAVALALMAFGLTLIGLRGHTAAADQTARASAAPRVVINHFAFHPPTLRIARGSRVVFANTSGVTHTATRDGSFDTGLIKPGKSVGIRFKQRGAFAYRCLIHPSMHGKVIVG
jgi:plastocyanin